MSEQTKIPWWADVQGQIKGCDGESVTAVQHCRDSEPTVESAENQRLILAAPEMLVALKLALTEFRAVKGFLNDGDSCGDQLIWRIAATESLIKEIETVIEKVELKTS